jgi:RHS repeat-associated protein
LTGKWWRAYSQLLFLRARYYEPTTGRFTQRDLWGGDYYQPQTLLWNYLYALNDPVNSVDPSGLYHSEVHKDLTKRLVSEIARSYGIETVCGEDVSKIISKYNQLVDTSPVLSSVPEGVSTYGCRRCHFCNWADTTLHIEDTIDPAAYLSPYFFGAALHQVQDYFSHWGEGYGEEGHAGHTTRQKVRTSEKLDDFFGGGHWEGSRHNKTWVTSPYPAHPEEQVRQFLQRTNPGVDISRLGKNDLIDLYLRRDQGRDPTMRDYYGFDPDKYIPGSSRDNLMEWFTRYYIRKFMDAIVEDPCAVGCREPKHETGRVGIRNLLTK